MKIKWTFFNTVIDSKSSVLGTLLYRNEFTRPILKSYRASHSLYLGGLGGGAGRNVQTKGNQ